MNSEIRRSWKLAFFILAVCLLLYLVWSGTKFAAGFQQQKRVHIFPTSVESKGWQNQDAALLQDLPDQAGAGSFNDQNAAYVHIEGEPASTSSDSIGAIGLPPAADFSTTTSATSTEQSAATSSAPDASSTPDLPPQSLNSPAQIASSTDARPEGQTGAQPLSFADLFDAVAHSLAALSGVAHAATDTSTSVSLSSTTSDILASTSASEATTSATSTPTEAPELVSPAPSPSLKDDVPTCTILNTQCHTMQFSDFAIPESLSEKKLRSFELNFSFAALTPENALDSGKLQVRYYHDGKWRSAGEIFLSKEVSNQTNGGYFKAKLEGLTKWDDMSDLQVAIEYVQGEKTASADVYLDSMWVDALYSERIQDLLSGKDLSLENLSDNISSDLAGQNANAALLVEDDGSQIAFPFRDNVNDDSLMIRSDKQRYAPGTHKTADVYISVTNSSSKDDSFRLYGTFPGARGAVHGLEKYVRNVPTVATSTQYENVTYYCASPWSVASSSTSYRCEESGEVHPCASIDKAGNNCLVPNEQIGVSTSTEYTSAWIDVPLSERAPGDSRISRDLPRGYEVESASDGLIDILAGQTLYFKVSLETPDSQTQRFVLFAAGSNYGDLNSMQLKTELGLTASPRQKGKGQQRAHVNDELSNKQDFAPDEKPQFEFKFRTQRGIVTRFLDFLSAKNVSFSVDRAKLLHQSGEEPNIPVQITYGNNGEFSAEVPQPPRDFRPGKYTLELTVSENGQSYQDSFDFYWGVLALNPEQDVYTPGESVHFSIAALDDDGNTNCDAQLVLSIESPSGQSADAPVISGGGCGHNNVTELPDFIAEYRTGKEGQYMATLSMLDDSGRVINSIIQPIEVAANAPYTITRKGPTRIYPPSAYTMHITVAPHAAVNGTVTELLPEGFIVSNAGGGTVGRTDGAITISWPIETNNATTKEFTYQFKAPDVSPYLFRTGSLFITDTDGHLIYTEKRSWAIASDATLIATGVAWLSATTTTNGSNLNNTSAAALQWTGDDYDTTYFSHSTTTNNTQLTIQVAGDYLVAVDVPALYNAAGNRNIKLETDIRVNGSKINQGVGRDFFDRTTGANNSKDSSAHLYMLLHNLNAGDYIEAFVTATSTINVNDLITIPTQASLYAEYIPSTETVFQGVATTTTSTSAPGNMIPSATSSIKWWDSGYRVDSGYTHANSGNPQDITLGAAGSYMVFINIPHTGALVDARFRAQVLLGGVEVKGAYFKQNYISNSRVDVSGSGHWSGVVVATSSTSALRVDIKGTAAVGTTTVAGDQASIYIQKLPTSDIYFARATTTSSGTNWNPVAAANIKWGVHDLIDPADYSFATSSSQNITVLKGGDYLLTYNDSLAGGTAADLNPLVSVSVNGAAQSGALSESHYVSNSSGDKESSGSLVYLLRNLNANDVISFSTVQDTVGGTLTTDKDALLMLWHKNAQSSYTQDTEAWYVGSDSATTTSRWPGLTEGDAITTGNAATSSALLRLRIALQAAVTTTANADSFKLQYAAGSTCSPALSWTDIGAAGSGSIWRGFDNASVSSGTTISSTDLQLSVSSTSETYEEGVTSAVAPNSIAAGKDGEWDWSLQDNGAPDGTSYCFRLVTASGQVLKNYNDYPQLITNNTPNTPSLLTLFDNEKTASTSPWFTFSSSDDNGDDIDYEIQVSARSDFSTTVIDDNSIANVNDFDNLTAPSDKSPFNSGQTVRYKDTQTALTNGNTYYWRVRGKDSNGTGNYGSWSSGRSFTVDTAVSVSTWFQTQNAQFNNDTLSNTEATTTGGVDNNDVGLSGANTTGSVYSQEIDYSSHTTGNSWGNVSWHNATSTGTILYHVEYFTSTSTWAIVPESDLPGNSAGTSTQPISIQSLDPTTYSAIRIRADFTKTTGTPRLQDWTVSWALSVAAPTQTSPFDNEKVSTTTPDFLFTTSDPQGDRLTYQIQVSSSTAFTSSYTRTSDSEVSSFTNATTPSDTQPFLSGNTIDFHLQNADRLASSTTFYWRVRAKDPTGGNAFSLWSSTYSFTTDTTVDRSTWYQTTTGQFNTDTLNRTTSSNGDATASSDTGKIAMYRAAAASETITTSVFKNTWDTTVRQDNIYSLSTNTDVLLSTGYYAIMYGVRFDRTNTNNNASAAQSGLVMSSSTLSIGWATADMRSNGGSFKGYTSGGGIVKVTTDNTPLYVESFRTDSNAAAPVTRAGGTSGIQVLRLDSTWNYARLSRATKQTGPTSANWTTVNYDREDEIDTRVYSHTTGSGLLTLKDAGHYLVFANTYGSITSTANSDSQVDGKLTLNGYDLPGSFTTMHFRANTNDHTREGAVSLGMIIQATTTNEILKVQLKRSVGTASWTIDSDQNGTYVDRTGLTVVKIPEADFIRLTNSTSTIINPAVITPLSYNTEDEKDTASFAHANATSTRVTVLTAGDYLFFNSNYAAPGTSANTEWYQIWRKNGASGWDQWGQAIGFNDTAVSDVGAYSAHIFPSLVANDFVESLVAGTSTTLGTIGDTSQELEGLRIGSLVEADTNAKTVESTPIVFTNGAGPKWDAASSSADVPSGTAIRYQLEYFTSTSSYNVVPDSALSGNASSGLSMPVNLSALDKSIYGTLKFLATFTCAGGSCPTLHEWQVTWAPGINVSGTIQKYDQVTSVSSGSVRVAVNGTLSTKVGTIINGAWTIRGVNASTGDVITVFVNNAATSTRAVGITKYTGSGDVTGMKLYELHLSLGSDDHANVTNADISQYDNSISSNAALFDEVDASNNLTLCPNTLSPCNTARLIVLSGNIYEPSSGPSVSVTTPNLQIEGTFIADGNTINVSRSWKNDAAFIKGSSTVVFTATSTNETIDSSAATSSDFYAVTFGQTSGAARWDLISPIGASSTISVNFGTFAPGATSSINLGGNLSIGSSGIFKKNLATTTFVGTGSNTWTDSTAGSQDLGRVIIAGTTKTITLGGNVAATDLTINAGETLDASSNNYSISVYGNWTNNNIFTAQSGTVTFAATTTGKTIAPGTSAFFNITFNGSGGNWAFSSAFATSTNNFTVSNGTVTLPTGTTTVGGSFDSSTGSFMHNNGAVQFNATASGKTINPGSNPFYDLAFNGSGGGWSFSSTNATSSRNTVITLGTVTAPSGTFEIGGSFFKNGGTFSAGSGTLKFSSASAQTLKLGGSNASTLLFSGGGTYTFLDVNATATATTTISSGSVTFPSGTFTIGGGLDASGGTFSNNSGTVTFNASATGKFINPGTSSFYNLLFNSSSGGWTISANATSTNDTTITNASSFTLSSGKSLEVRGTFTNSVGGAPTTWTGSTLYLNSGTSYSINAKANTGDSYATLLIGTNTNIRSWGSSATTVSIPTNGSLYSQNNTGVSGSLYIYGAWASTGNEYWSYAADFDGTVLSGGSRRQVNVRIASNSTLQYSGSNTLQILGDQAASTTIANQGSGTYSFLISGGTINAQYYTVASTSAMGLGLQGSPTVTSLANGDFTITTNGGSGISASSTVIDANPTLQILQVRFATTSVLASAFNVTETGTPTDATNFWWYKHGYGNMYGENFDSDPGPGSGNPGYIQFDDSGFTVTISGHVYSDHGATAIGNPPCDGSTAVVKIVTSDGNSYSSFCAAGSGAYSVANVFFRNGATINAYLDTNGGKRASTVTKDLNAGRSDFDLYQNALIVRQAASAALTNADLASVDSSVDSDIPFTISGNDITVKPDNELFVWTGKLYAPGGNVTLQSGGSGLATDGRLWLGANSTTTLTGSPTITIGGGLFADTAASFSTASSTLVFTATTTGKSIQTALPLTLWNATWNGSGGQWSLDSAAGVATTTVVNTFTFSAGTIIGAGDLAISSGGLTGGGTFTMTGGSTVRLEGTGNFGNSNNWQFYNLTLGSTTAATITKTGIGTTTIAGVLKVTSNETLNAGTTAWVLSGGGTPFSISGTFNVQTAPFYYTATTSTTVANANYAALLFEPAAGSPTFTLSGGTPTIYSLTVGDGTHGATVTADTNDPSIAITSNVIINGSGTFIASNVGALNVTGSWINAGTFTHSSGSVLFNATTTGQTIQPGSSPFYDLQLNSSAGGWTITSNATSSHNFQLTAASSFTLSSGKNMEIGGTFTNSVGGAPTTWTNSTLYLNSGTNYTINTKSAGNDSYGTLLVGANTQIRMWNSSTTVATTFASGSLYSQNNASSSGALAIWGAYARSSGSDYWSYATNFDGTDISGSPRTVTVTIASSSSLTYSGGVLNILGDPAATTSVTTIGGVGAYAFSVSGGTFDANYYQIRNTDTSGLAFSGSPTVQSLSYGDFLVARNGSSAMTVAGSVITQNPLLLIRNAKFATTSVLTNSFNVTATGATGSFWKFTQSYGNFQGEAFDNDPQGDPGYIRWDDSNIGITISGHVYSDEASSVSSGCDGSLQLVVLKVEGGGSFTASCAVGTGAYSIANVGFNPGDILTLYLASSSKKSATVSRGPTADISGMDIYEHRVIVRHEDATPLTIADMDQWDSGNDSNVPFLATQGGTNTLTVIPNTKLVVWTGKTFAPAGNVTLQSGGTGTSYDGSLELYSNSTFSAAGSQSHSVGGNFTVDSGAAFTAANSTVTFTATTTGKTITPLTSTFYNIVFNGTGGNWAFGQTDATSTNDFTVSVGTVTLPTGTLEVGGSIKNTGGTLMHNNGTVKLTSTASGKLIQENGSSLYNLIASSTTGSWSFVDAIATTSNDTTIVAGTLTLPSNTLVVGGSFLNSGGTFAAQTGTVTFNATAGAKSVQARSSAFYNLLFNGQGGSWSFIDTNATTSHDVTVSAGTTTAPSGTLAVGGSFTNASKFVSNSGTVSFVSTSTGNTISIGSSTLYNLLFNSASGGWTISANATSSNTTTILAASTLTLAAGKTLEVDGAFSNSQGSATTWTNSILYLNSGTAYTINSKSDTSATYGTLLLGTNTQVSMWKSSAATTTVLTGAYLYSQNHANVNGSLYIFGAYSKTSGTDYWSYATDFDGSDISGSPRQVNVRIATSSSVSYTNATLSIIGGSGATTTVRASGTTNYPFTIAGGTFTANYYEFKNGDQNGVSLSGTVTVPSMDNGYFEVSAASSTALTLNNTALDTNGNLSITNVGFATTSSNIKAANVVLTGTPGSSWTFSAAWGNIAGEAFDEDGTTACGHIRWDDSSCQFISQEHYRFRNDNGGEAAPSSDWYNPSWLKRERIGITNPNNTAYTNIPIKIDLPYKASMKANFDDILFTDSTGTSTIKFWRESTVNSATTTVWVKIASLPAGGTAIIYVYYGNASAAAADDSTTFSYLEDFEDNTISDFSGDTTGGYFSTNGSFAHNGSVGLAGSETSGQTPNGLYVTGSSQSAQGQTIRWFQYVDTAVGSGSDEPCTFFGVQATPTAGDYAVCLDEFTSGANKPRVSLARDTHSRDLSAASVMASTSVSFSQQWYEIVVDWLTTGAINVHVYNPNGTTFASISTTTASSNAHYYTSGGVGFGHFNQNGGWDTLMVKPYTATTPTYVIGPEQGTGGASWATTEDDDLAGVSIGSNVRLRFNIQNSGTLQSGQLFRLQVADKANAVSCAAVPEVSYNDVPTTAGGCGSSFACMTSSSQFTNLTATTPLLTYPAAFAFASGQLLQNPSNQTASSTVGANTATEVEYNFQMTNYATGSNYCFRATNGGLDLANYAVFPSLSVIHPPIISNIALNNAADIVLTEGTTTTISASCTITDDNGYNDISFATSTIYRSGVGVNCAADQNNCYNIASTSCERSNCSGNSCTFTCSAKIQYFAEPTDATSTMAAQNWLATIAVQDLTGLRDTQTSLGVDVLTLYGLDIVTGPIDFGSLHVGENTGSVNATTTIVNTGNSPINVQLSGTDLANGGNSIAVGEQKYATSTFVYGSCSICQFLTGSAASVGVSVAKPTSTAPTIQNQANIYFGVDVPNGSAATSYSGTNTFIAVGG
jgi:hypothetical protein